MTGENPDENESFEAFLREQGTSGAVYEAAQAKVSAWEASRPVCKCSALDIAAYIVESLAKAGMTPSTVKLHKLLYYAQAWSLVRDDHPLFPGNRSLPAAEDATG
jgi:hypothetical protein